MNGISTPTEALKKIAAKIEHLIDPAVRPAQYVRDIHRQWKVEGGKLPSGKPKHSERHLEDKLKEAGTPIRSLTPKLNGKTILKPHDAAVLLRYCLSNWPIRDGDGAGYTKILTNDEIDDVCAYIEDRIDNSAPVTTAVIPAGEAVVPLPGDPMQEVITRQFQECDAMVIVSPESTLVTAKPKTELIGFRNLLNDLWFIERRDRKPRTLIWVLDGGDQRFEDLQSRKKFLNVQALGE